MSELIEIIPDDLPDWMIKAMADGQLFNTILKLEDIRIGQIKDRVPGYMANLILDWPSALSAVSRLKQDVNNLSFELEKRSIG